MIEPNVKYVKYEEVEKLIRSQKEELDWIERNIEKASNNETKGYWVRRKGASEVTLYTIEEWAKGLTTYISDDAQ